MHYLQSCGIGDFLAWLGFVPDYPTKITLATARADSIAEICYILKIPCEVLDSSRAYLIKAQVEAVHGDLDMIDASNGAWMHKVLNGTWTVQRNPIDHVPFPRLVEEDYDIFVPISLNAAPGRNLTKEEIEWVYAKSERKLVVLNKTKITLPPNDKIINYSGMTNMFQALACCKYCKGYWGADTWASTACSQQKVRLVVKSCNPYWWAYKAVWTNNDPTLVYAHARLGNWIDLDKVRELTTDKSLFGKVDRTAQVDCA